MLKRTLLWLLVFCMTVSGALAEGLLPFEDCSNALATVTLGEWTDEDAFFRILTLDANTTLSACLDDAQNVAALTLEGAADGALAQTALAVLEALNLLGEETLASIPEIAASDSLTADGYTIYHLSGRTREGYAICLENSADALVWQPVHGGKKQHAKADCSGMDVARLITAEAAEALGYDPCGRCMANSAG